MASYTKTAKGYRVFLEIKGVRKTKSFATKREAKEWADYTEFNLRNAAALPLEGKYTLRQALEKYRDEVCDRNVGARWEKVRINAFIEHPEWIPINRLIGDITTDDFTAFSVERAKTVKPGTILREFGLLSAVMEVARREWKWVATNPVRDVRKPQEPHARERLITRAEIKSMLRGLGYSPLDKRVTTISQSIAVCFMTALRTGMRAGDMTNLAWADVFPRHVSVKLDKIGRKRGKGRDVPLSLKAVRVIKKMKGFDPISVFGLAPATLEARFRTIRVRQGLSGFTFHDSRHTAATWIAGKFKSNENVTAQQAIFDMCKIFGWSDPKRALAYYNPNPEDIASRLD